ncbi:hypothetical protein BSL78_28830 [Apostichopus japonicus]|uniref:Uncharacterized protein n=1 Tax=Stichopus japonicus TaxID=307972 RepID=A0A2G8JF35_STIJA|nr:hypothetical protein BSL78_28830 [Apostichopus japonicus]
MGVYVEYVSLNLKKAKVDQPKTDVSQANAVTVITQNRLTRKLGIYNQGKKSNKVSRDSIIIPETVQAQTEEGLKRILDIRPAEKSESISPWSCDKNEKKKSSTSSCHDNPAVTHTTLNNWVLHKTPPQSSKLIQSDGTISSKSCDLTDGSSSSKISGIKEFPKVRNRPYMGLNRFAVLILQLALLCLQQIPPEPKQGELCPNYDD